jgi:glyoxylase-like metal-dependent hydrolase (beta-lactamase superfamily II)
MEEILPHLYRVVVPLPRNPLKEVNSYILTSDDRNLIIDTGMNRPECLEVLTAGIKEIGIDLEKTDIIATHYHADHQGLVATFLKDGSSAFMGEKDAAAMNLGATTHARKMPMGDYAALSGFPEEVLLEAQKNHPGFKYGPQTTVDYIPVNEEKTFHVGDFSLNVIETPGHTEGHIALYEPNRKIFFSGDHVLGDITPNIQAWTDDYDPLDLYINSLKKVHNLDVDMCYPAHRSFIPDLKKRVSELMEHHRTRANEVIDILEGKTLSSYETAGLMSWDIVAKSWDDFPVMQKWFATGEAIAHLRYLENKDCIRREMVDGKIFYTTDGKKKLATV